MSQIDDVEAIHTYMLNQPSNTTKAETIKTQFLTWYENASWWDKNMSADWYNDMRSRRNAFNLANATTAKDLAFVQNTLATGLTQEQIDGKPRPVINIHTGKVGTAEAVPLSDSGVPKLTRVLKSGLNGPDVKQWQSFLGLTPPTGYFDALTVQKTKAFQTKAHLTVDGAVGPKTWSKAFPVADSPLTDGSLTGATSAQFAPSPTLKPTPAQVSQAKAAAQSAAAPISAIKQAVAPHVDAVVTAGMNPSKWPTSVKVVGLAAGALLVAGKMSDKPHKTSHRHR